MKARAFLVASLKMSSTFSWYLAEHSRYRSAFICCRVSSPCDQRETSSGDCNYLLFRQVVVLVSGLHASSYTDLYLDAHTFCHTCVYVMGSWLRALSFLVHSLSFLRSVLQPIRMTGISLQKCLTSGNHWKRKKIHKSVFLPPRYHLVVELHGYSRGLRCFTVLILSAQTEGLMFVQLCELIIAKRMRPGHLIVSIIHQPSLTSS